MYDLGVPDGIFECWCPATGEGDTTTEVNNIEILWSFWKFWKFKIQKFKTLGAKLTTRQHHQNSKTDRKIENWNFNFNSTIIEQALQTYSSVAGDRMVQVHGILIESIRPYRICQKYHQCSKRTSIELGDFTTNIGERCNWQTAEYEITNFSWSLIFENRLISDSDNSKLEDLFGMILKCDVRIQTLNLRRKNFWKFLRFWTYLSSYKVW